MSEMPDPDCLWTQRPFREQEQAEWERLLVGQVEAGQFAFIAARCALRAAGLAVARRAL